MIPKQDQEFAILTSTVTEYMLKIQKLVTSPGGFTLPPSINRLFPDGIPEEEALRIYGKDASTFIHVYKKFADCEEMSFKELIVKIHKSLEDGYEGEGDGTKITQSALICLTTGKRDFFPGSRRVFIFDAVNMFLKISLTIALHEKDLTREQFHKIKEGHMFRLFRQIRTQHHSFHYSLPYQGVRFVEEENGDLSTGSYKYGPSYFRAIVFKCVEDYNTIIKTILPETLCDVEKVYEIMMGNVSRINDGDEALYSSLLEGKCGRYSEAWFESYKYNTEDWENKEVMLSRMKVFLSLNSLLFVLVQLTCGLPYRVSELLTLKFADVDKNNENISIVGGDIDLNISPCKKMKRLNQESTVTKRLPLVVTRLIVHYITICRVIELTICEKYIPEEDAEGLNSDEEIEKKLDDREEGVIAKRIIHKSYRDSLQKYLFMGPHKENQWGRILRTLERQSYLAIGYRYNNDTLRRALTYFVGKYC